jgi:hypothetical protein
MEMKNFRTGRRKQEIAHIYLRKFHGACACPFRTTRAYETAQPLISVHYYVASYAAIFFIEHRIVIKGNV